MTSNIIDFPQQKAWDDARELAKEEEQRKREERKRIEYEVQHLYQSSGWSNYARLLSDPPSVFKVRRHGQWRGRGHFIANREHMPIRPASIIDDFNGGLIISEEV